jgi:hypothetical protein
MPGIPPRAAPHFAVIREAPPGFEARFWQIRRGLFDRRVGRLCNRVRLFHRFTQIAPQATQRELANFGGLFSPVQLLVRNGDEKKLQKFNGSSADDLVRFVKFVSVGGSQYNEILGVFLMFDRLVFQNKFFMSALSERVD